jgi:hypothetical protein
MMRRLLRATLTAALLLAGVATILSIAEHAVARQDQVQQEGE